MARYSVPFKTEVVLYAQNNCTSEAAYKYGLNDRTIRYWRKRYRESGAEGFIVRRTYAKALKLDKKALLKIYELKKADPSATLKMIKDKFGLTCNLTLIWQKLKNLETEINSGKKKKLTSPPYTRAENKNFLKKKTKALFHENNEDSIKDSLTGYRTVYSELAELKTLSRKKCIKFLLTKAEYYIKKDCGGTAFLLLRDALENSEKSGNKKLTAEGCYIKGMIYEKYYLTEQAEKYYKRSVGLLKGFRDNISLYSLYMVKYSLFILKKDFDNAERTGKMFLKYAFKTKKAAFIGNALGASFQHLYHKGRYKEYAVKLRDAKDYNIEKGNYYSVCGNLINLLNVYLYHFIWNDADIEQLRKELKLYSEKAVLPLLYRLSDISIGIKLFRNNEYSRSLSYFERSIKFIKSSGRRELYFSCLYYYGTALLKTGEMNRAIRRMNILYRESSLFSNIEYRYLAAKTITVINLRKTRTSPALKYCREVLATALNRKDNYTLGKFSYYMAVLRKNPETRSFYFKEAEKYFNLHKETTGSDISADIETLNISKNRGIGQLFEVYNHTARKIRKNKYKKLFITFFFYYLLLNYKK